MRKRVFYIILLTIFVCGTSSAQDNRNTLPDLQTTESIFFDPNAKEEADPYVFSTPLRLEAGYVQLNHRTQDTSALYLHGLRLGATVDFTLPHNFSIQTGALATLAYGINKQHWPIVGEENAQINILKHNIVQLQLSIPVRAYYNVKLWKKLNLFFYAGPQLQIGLTNYDILKNNTSADVTDWLQQNNILTTKHDKYITKELYRTNIQFGIGGGLEWDRYRLQAGYDFGLNNILRTSVLPKQKLNEWGWLCTFSYQL